MISEAGKFGVKLILSLVNNYDDYGGKRQYVEWAKARGQQIQNVDGFYTNPMVKDFYKNHIKVFFNCLNYILLNLTHIYDCLVADLIIHVCN